jgi:twitching motility protein PilJ
MAQADQSSGQPNNDKPQNSSPQDGQAVMQREPVALNQTGERSGGDGTPDPASAPAPAIEPADTAIAKPDDSSALDDSAVTQKEPEAPSQAAEQPGSDSAPDPTPDPEPDPTFAPASAIEPADTAIAKPDDSSALDASAVTPKEPEAPSQAAEQPGSDSAPDPTPDPEPDPDSADPTLAIEPADAAIAKPDDFSALDDPAVTPKEPAAPSQAAEQPSRGSAFGLKPVPIFASASAPISAVKPTDVTVAKLDDLSAKDDQAVMQKEPAASSRLSEAPSADSMFALSVIGESKDPSLTHKEVFARTAVRYQRAVLLGLVVVLIWLAAVAYQTMYQSRDAALQVSATGQALMQSQRLAKSVTQALVGNPTAFAEVKESAQALSQNIRGLQSGNDSMPVVPAAYAADVAKIAPLVERADRNATVVLGQQQALTQSSTFLRAVSRQSSDLLGAADAVLSIKLQNNAPAAEITAASHLVMLTQRIGKSASEFLSLQGVRPDAALLFGKDLDAFKETAEGLLGGSQKQQLAAARDERSRDRLTTLLKAYGQMRTQADDILGNLQGLASAREAQSAIVADSEPLRAGLEGLQRRLSGESGLDASDVLLRLLPPALIALALILVFGYAQLRDSRRRQQVAERQRRMAERQQVHIQRVNDANEAAILRLMNELQVVAEGDLTQEATVTEDITGAIADSVNYTVEELRSLVGNVQGVATRVAQTTSKVETTSTELLMTSTEQLREIRQTGQSVLDMATRINDVSAQAQESAAVARQSLQAADSGLTAVQNTIGGMNTIRDQIQETSKRIKRLGESSQEIGEITELIADITEQTNVLALNAAIQAASAGEAGRGFSVVAEEVQRLAERSGDATRQIAALVKAIQTDTQDAVAAMERSTRGVVEGARLSDNAGTALTEIDRVSRRLAQLIEQISASASKEAEQANEVAGNIQHIFTVTEQTGARTRSTANQIRELARIADELRRSVARFKIV